MPDNSTEHEMFATITMVREEFVEFAKLLGNGEMFEDGSQKLRGITIGHFPPGKYESHNRYPALYTIYSNPDREYKMNIWEWIWDEERKTLNLQTHDSDKLAQETHDKSYFGECIGEIVSILDSGEGRAQMSATSNGIFLGEPVKIDCQIDGKCNRDGLWEHEMTGTATFIDQGIEVSWRSMGTGAVFDDGTQAWRGALCFRFPHGKYEEKNRSPFLYPIDSDANHKHRFELREWDLG